MRIPPNPIYGRPEMRAKQSTWLVFVSRGVRSWPARSGGGPGGSHRAGWRWTSRARSIGSCPARVTARPGDILRFRVSSGSPHNVTFEAKGLSPGARDALDAAMPNRTGELSSPVLDRPGAEYRIVVPALPPGRYPFFCTPHRVYDMRGELIVPK